MKKKSVTKILLSVMVLLVSVAFCACGSNKSTESSETGNSSSEKTTESAADDTQADAANSDTSCIVVGLTQEISSLDPHEDTDAGTRSVLFNVFEGLVKPTTDGDVTPAVASDYTISDDAKTYTFTLRDGITFQDGNPVTVEDIKYSLERSAEKDGESSALSVISDITCVDDKTIQLTLSEANSEFIYNLTVAVLEQANDADQATNPIGTGPFKITNFAEGQYLEMEKYDGYWNKDLDYVQSAKFKFISDAQAAFLELQAGTIDMLQYLTNDQVQALSDDYNIVESTMMLIHGLFLNNTYEPLKDVRVRQALNYAVDRDAINEFLFGGKSKIIQTHGYPTITAWYNADTEGTYTYDVDKAKELLAEAGYADGFDLEITVPSSYTQHVQTAEIIAEQLAAVGVNVTINQVEWSSWLSDVYQGRDYQSTIIGFDISSLSPATWYKRYYTDSSNDFTNFSNTEYDEKYGQALATIDHDEKHQLYGELQQILTVIIGSLLLGAAGLANYFVLMFRSSPILPWDLFSVGVAATVADNFEYKLSVRACNVILLIMLLWSLALKMRLKLKMSKIRGVGIAVMCAAFLGFCGYVQTDEAIASFKMDTTLFTPTVYYRNNGLALSFIVNLRYMKIDKPEGYSQEALSAIQEEAASGNSSEKEAAANIDLSQKPNIIVIMNEAFSDLSVVGDYKTNEDVMPFIHSLTENTQKGWMYSSVKGGNTANTEFEFLTGLSMYFLPTGSIAYQQYIKSEMPALPWQLSSLGYTSVAMHPYYPKGWNRDTVYDDLGFEEKYFKDDFSNPEVLRTYISDWTTYQKIIERYEEKDAGEKLFVFDVTMQNHGSYVKRYSNFIPDVSIVNGKGTYLAATEQYLSLIRRSDEAFEQLVEYFRQQSEPTIIMMFGDHQPADYITNVVDDGKIFGTSDDSVTSIGTGSDRKERYIVPFIMWANYDIDESQDEETSANYLAVRLLKAAGLPMTDFQSYLAEMEKDIPFISAHVLKKNEDAQGGTDEAEKLLATYNKLLYNDLFDTKHRLQNFFSYE